MSQDRFFLIFLITQAFLIGAIPTGYIIGRIWGVDLRSKGSKNIGATNAARVLGKTAGLITLFVDMIKGILSLELARVTCEQFDSYGGFNSEQSLLSLLAFVIMCGHCFSPFLKFSGGKGVATGGGIFLYLAPSQTFIAVIIFVITFSIWRIVSVSSILAAVTIPSLLILSSNKVHPLIAATSLLCSALIVVRHKQNLLRLAAGKEPKFMMSKQEANAS